MELEHEISSILDETANGSDLWFGWQVLKGHLGATQLFISPSEIVFRPILPPTSTYAPFANANQRIYMSATLGRGGELQRLSGRKAITPLPSPRGWNGHGVGRRFFIMPDVSLSEEETLPESISGLSKSASHEIDYVTALWKGDYATAVDSAQRVIDALSGGPELKGFRGMWHYLAGCAEFHLAEEQRKVSSKAEQHFQTACSVAGMRIGRQQLQVELPDSTASPLDQAAIQSMEAELCELGLRTAGKYTRLELDILNDIQKARGEKFESGHQKLGTLLGFNSQNSDGEGAPDPWWQIEDSLCFVFEDHIKKSDGDKLELDKARQANSHPNWIKEYVSGLREDSDIIPVLLTNADVGSKDCQLQLQGVAVWPLADFREWAKRSLEMIRSLRAELQNQGDLVWRAKAITSLESISATPSTLRAKLEGMKVHLSVS